MSGANIDESQCILVFCPGGDPVICKQTKRRPGGGGGVYKVNKTFNIHIICSLTDSHSTKNNLNLLKKTELVTAGADVIVCTRLLF